MHGGESEVWEMKMVDTLVVVDNKNVKIEEKGCSGEDKRVSGHEIVWNDAGGNQMDLSPMNEDLRNREEDVDEEQKEWEVGVQWEARLRPQPNHTSSYHL